MRRSTIDYTNKDAASLTQALLDLARERLPLWTDHSPNDLGVMLFEAFAHMGDLLLYYQDRIANESYLETAIEPRSVVHLLRLIGYELEPSKPASVDLSLLFDKDAVGTRVIKTGTEFQTTRETAGEVISFRYLGPDLSIDLERDGAAPWPADEVDPPYRRWDSLASGQRLSVRQVERQVPDEIVGSSDGSPGQRFALRLSPVIDDSLEVMVVEGGRQNTWQRVETLLHSQPGDRHYQVRRDENERVWIEFGTGTQGQVPLRGVNNILASYLVGGGARGNVAPGTIVKPGALTDSIVGLKASTHGQPASGGADREPLPVAAQRGPLQFRSQNRVVTADDFVSHALELGIAKARAFHQGWNRVHLYVAPAGGGWPSDTLLEQVRQHLDRKRVMTTILEVRKPQYISVDVGVVLEVEPTFFASEVEQAARAAVQALLAFDNVDFGQTLYISKLYEAIEALDGVRGVTINKFQKHDGGGDATDGRLTFEEREIPTLGTLEWATHGGHVR